MAVRCCYSPSVSRLCRRHAHALLGSGHASLSQRPWQHAQSRLRSTGRAGAVECGRSDGRRRRAACRMERTARGRGHVRGAEALCQGRGEQVREEVQTVRCVTTVWLCSGGGRKSPLYSNNARHCAVCSAACRDSRCKPSPPLVGINGPPAIDINHLIGRRLGIQ